MLHLYTGIGNFDAAGVSYDRSQPVAGANPVKNKRFCAIFLLAVLALLQVRVALAACTIAQPASGPTSVCCDMQGATAKQMAPMHDAACAIENCFESATAQAADHRALASSQGPQLPGAVALTAPSAPVPATSFRISLAAAHPPHTPLIYVLQRLLI